jgi:hypothetical protein
VQLGPEDKLAAAVFAVGLLEGFVRREDVVLWADSRIESTDAPPEWLLDLSLSHNFHILDLVGLLNRVSEGVDPVSTCRAVYALLPEVGAYTFDRAASFAARLYGITYVCFKGDWSHELLSTADQLADEFELLRGGYVRATEGEVVAALQRFVREHRNMDIVRLLHPVRWSDAEEVPAPTPEAAPRDPRER